jgi:hypothetical protein
LASGGGAVAAAFVGVHRGVVRGDHGLVRAFLELDFVGGGTPLFCKKRAGSCGNKENWCFGAGAKKSKRAWCAFGRLLVGAGRGWSGALTGGVDVRVPREVCGGLSVRHGLFYWLGTGLLLY